MILVLGQPDDGCVREVVAHLQRQGRATLLVPEARLHAALQIRWELPASSDYLRFEGRSVRLEELSAVFVWLRQAFQANLAAPDDASYIRVEWSALLYGWLKSLPCPVVNRPRPGAGLGALMSGRGTVGGAGRRWRLRSGNQRFSSSRAV